MFAPPPPLTRGPDAEPVPPLLERLRLDLLAKVPEKRPATAADAKQRLQEAMSRERTEARLPTRKGDEPLGDRAARAPVWDRQESAPRTERTIQRTVGLLRFTDDPGGITGECETGLRAHRLDVVPLRALADVAAQGVTVVVLDVAGKIDEARAALETLKKIAPACHAVVCAAQLDTERMNALVGAGAADVARYPVTPDALSRKLERVLKRGR
jgi:serine/threonine-protein kinase